ncbi:twin-arginine translocase TatA/TatE family subunit [Citricoccus sp.]|uniref:twin-arginine translocase TatA/TatE family subunit n=1 Tax=Citricoccus sp. TaxID=1978372 RepID=UPI0028BDCDF1|nr:twin-arginine translocase TatA/TatE family subunit [Citricoccus sp.]
MTFGINGAELIILALLAVLILGPEKLPEYARKLTEWIRNLRRMAEGAKTQFREETGTDFDEIDWKKYDPRQYDPRRIIKDALADPVDGDTSGSGAAGASGGSATAARSARGGLRGELGSVRSQRDELREDLKDMDPRALFFGKTSRRSESRSAANAGAPDGERAQADDRVDELGGPEASGDARDSTGAGGSGRGRRGGADADAAAGQPAGAAVASGASVTSVVPRGPAPFDVDAT